MLEGDRGGTAVPLSPSMPVLSLPHVELCQMCPHVLTYRCWHMRVHVSTHPRLHGHTRAHCMVMWLHRHTALHTCVPAWQRAHPAMHASTWSHTVTHVHTRVIYLPMVLHMCTHAQTCSLLPLTAPCLPHDLGCPWGCATWRGGLGGNHKDWLMDLTLLPRSHGLWRGQP